jgi:hypothetical protein
LTPTIEKESNKPTQKTTEANTSTDTVGTKQKLGKRITIGSLNIQNIRGNTIFAQSIMKETEILFIQEHWLFKFEEKEFTTLIPNTDHYVRFIDEDSPINHSECIRGYGGVAILWHPNLTPCIRPLPDGTNHIIAIELEAEPTPLCMINAYMP